MLPRWSKEGNGTVNKPNMFPSHVWLRQLYINAQIEGKQTMALYQEPEICRKI